MVLDPWEGERELAVLEPPARSPLAGRDMGMLTEEVTPCPKCGSCVTGWAKGELVPQCERCGLRAIAVTGYRIVWPGAIQGFWTEAPRHIPRPPHTHTEAKA